MFTLLVVTFFSAGVGAPVAGTGALVLGAAALAKAKDKKK